ncbi:MAG: hypothetical protein ACKO6N_14610 [Myxococcota bacterium]
MMERTSSTSEPYAHAGCHSVPAGQPLEHVCRCQAHWLTGQLKAPMVRWFELKQLLTTGVQVLISTTMGKQLDARNLEGLFEDELPPQHRYVGGEDGALWFDYVSDVGDGFKPTYQVAHLLARPSVTLKMAGADGSPVSLPRGRFLLMGGDQVYPLASRDAYKKRLLGPYQLAWDQVMGARWQPGQGPRAEVEVYAIPGNHDWYDGLVSFRRLFCQDPKLMRRFVGDWKAEQGRSYFVIQLPSRWWIWAVDVQLESDIDEVQLRYFKERAQQLQPGDQVLLLTAEPEWVLTSAEHPAQDTREGESWGQESNLLLLRRFVTQRQATVRVTVAGDLHHYRRHSLGETPEQAEHLIIAGGGGAFLHPTHGIRGDSTEAQLPYLARAFALKASFPSEEDSRRLTWGLWKFPFQNLGLMTFLGVWGVGICWGLPMPVQPEPMTPLAFLLAAPGPFFAATSWLSMLLTLAPVLAFTGLNFRQRRTQPLYVVFSMLCGLLLVSVPLGLHVGLTELVARVLGPAQLTDFWLGLLRLIFFSVSSGVGMAGGLALYLGVSLNLFRAHSNEAFSALAGEHYKSFLRFHLTPDGTLEIFPLGVTRVHPHPCEADVHLIEPPIRVPRGENTAQSGVSAGSKP